MDSLKKGHDKWIQGIFPLFKETADMVVSALVIYHHRSKIETSWDGSVPGYNRYGRCIKHGLVTQRIWRITRNPVANSGPNTFSKSTIEDQLLLEANQAKVSGRN